MSQYYGTQNIGLDNPFEASAAHGVQLVRDLLEKGIWGGESYQMFYNVNFPPVPANEVKGTKIVRQGLRKAGGFGVEAHTPPNGRKYLWIKGNPQNVGSGPDSDGTANIDGYISVTPMRCDLTAHDVLDDLRERMA
jgi:5'-nucleotidase